jgi:hypothetical protein
MKHSIVRLLAVGLFLGTLFSSTISMANAEISPIDICAQHHGCVFIEDPLRYLLDPPCLSCGLVIDMPKFDPVITPYNKVSTMR